LPSAAGFVDPLLSTGFPLTLLGVGRLARILEDTLAGRQLELALNEYSRQTLAELDATEQVIGALYASMDDPETFNALTLLYFAAATWSETVRRLHHPERAAGFLLRDDPQFGPATREICTRVLAMRRRDEWNETSRNEIIREVQETIRPFDVAGLTSQSRRNWYPVQIDDLLRAHGRLGVSADRVKQMLRECGALVDECRADDRALSISGP
jgi:FADH2 O2-dependent halogenase